MINIIKVQFKKILSKKLNPKLSSVSIEFRMFPDTQKTNHVLLNVCL